MGGTPDFSTLANDVCSRIIGPCEYFVFQRTIWVNPTENDILQPNLPWDDATLEGAGFVQVCGAGGGGGGGDPDQNLFETVRVAGQLDVVADSTTDILRFVAGTDISITTDPATDSVTISATGAATDTHLLGNNLIQLANRNHQFNNFTQDWNNVGTLDFQINTRYVSVVGTAPNQSTVEQTTTAALIQYDIATGSNIVLVDNNGVGLDFEPNSDLKLDGVAGLLDQYLASQGPNTPPVWKSIPGVCTPVNDTTVNIMALRTAGSLTPDCIYEINDHSQGYLTGITIRLRATATNRFAMQCDVIPDPAWDAVNSWPGMYDCSTNKVVELRDNKGNYVKEHDGGVVGQFPWGATNWEDNEVVNGTLIVEASPTSTVSRNRIRAYADLTSYTGTMTSNFIGNTLLANGASIDVTGNQMFGGQLDTRNNTNSPAVFFKNNILAPNSGIINIAGAADLEMQSNFVMGTATNMVLSTDGNSDSNVTNCIFNDCISTVDFGYIAWTKLFVNSATVNSTTPPGPEVAELGAGLTLTSGILGNFGQLVNTHLDTVQITNFTMLNNFDVETKNNPGATTPNVGPIVVRYLDASNSIDIDFFGGTNALNNEVRLASILDTGNANFFNNYIARGHIENGANAFENIDFTTGNHWIGGAVNDGVTENYNHLRQLEGSYTI